MADENYLEHQQRIHRTAFGEEMSDDEIVKDFRLQPIEARTATLMRIDDDLSRPIGSDSHSLRRAAESLELRRRLGAEHAILTKINR